jgi:hypothetical protein
MIISISAEISGIPGSTMMHSPPAAGAMTQQLVANIGAGNDRMSIQVTPISRVDLLLVDAQGTFDLYQNYAHINEGKKSDRRSNYLPTRQRGSK